MTSMTFYSVFIIHCKALQSDTLQFTYCTFSDISGECGDHGEGESRSTRDMELLLGFRLYINIRIDY